MELGQIVDFCIEYNNMSDASDLESSKEHKATKRKATQADWDAFFG